MSKNNRMKTFTLTAIVAGLIVIPFFLRKKQEEPVPVPLDEDKRYDTTDDTLDWDL